MANNEKNDGLHRFLSEPLSAMYYVPAELSGVGFELSIFEAIHGIFSAKYSKHELTVAAYPLGSRRLYYQTLKIPAEHPINPIKQFTYREVAFNKNACLVRIDGVDYVFQLKDDEAEALLNLNPIHAGIFQTLQTVDRQFRGGGLKLSKKRS